VVTLDCCSKVPTCTFGTPCSSCTCLQSTKGPLLHGGSGPKYQSIPASIWIWSKVPKYPCFNLDLVQSTKTVLCWPLSQLAIYCYILLYIVVITIYCFRTAPPTFDSGCPGIKPSISAEHLLPLIPFQVAVSIGLGAHPISATGLSSTSITTCRNISCVLDGFELSTSGTVVLVAVDGAT
jgi:hypothetical protein